jgi:hypothetical protein
MEIMATHQYKEWTSEEDKLLKKLYGTMTLDEVGKKLGGRSASSVKNRASYIKIVAPRFEPKAMVDKPAVKPRRPAYQVTRVNDYTTRVERTYPRTMS